MNRVRLFSPHQRLAGAGLLLASFLEICGCNPVRDCEQLRDTQISSLPWDVLVERCAQCLNANEFLSLEQAKKKSADAGISEVPPSSQTVEQAIHGVQGLSFSDPDQSGPDTRSSPAQAPALLPVYASLDDKPILWPIPESVYFLYETPPAAAAPAPTSMSPRRVATAFIVSIPDRQHRTSARYLVTARHVVDPEWAHCSEAQPESILIRLNKRAGGFAFATLRLQNDGVPSFTTPDDGTSDLAIIKLDEHLIPNLDDYQLLTVPFHMIPESPELARLKRDQQIMTAALPFSQLTGLHDYPRTNPGFLSKITGETSNIQCEAGSAATPLHLWLIRSRVTHGLSGAPVYTTLSRVPDTPPVTVLLGIQSAVWPDKGIAGITPSTVLSDLIEAALSKQKIAMDFHKGPFDY